MKKPSMQPVRLFKIATLACDKKITGLSATSVVDKPVLFIYRASAFAMYNF